MNLFEDILLSKPVPSASPYDLRLFSQIRELNRMPVPRHVQEAYRSLSDQSLSKEDSLRIAKIQKEEHERSLLNSSRVILVGDSIARGFAMHYFRSMKTFVCDTTTLGLRSQVETIIQRASHNIRCELLVVLIRYEDGMLGASDKFHEYRNMLLRLKQSLHRDSCLVVAPGLPTIPHGNENIQYAMRCFLNSLVGHGGLLVRLNSVFVPNGMEPKVRAMFRNDICHIPGRRFLKDYTEFVLPRSNPVIAKLRSQLPTSDDEDDHEPPSRKRVHQEHCYRASSPTKYNNRSWGAPSGNRGK